MSEKKITDRKIIEAYSRKQLAGISIKLMLAHIMDITYLFFY